MLRIVKTSQEITELRSMQKKTIGFVPTMGNLHLGHLSLLEKALEDNEIIYLSIFVNPKQFGPNEDFNRYPRTLEADVTLIENCLKKFPEKEVFIFAPRNTEEIFPFQTDMTISVTDFNEIIEGQRRPGHFDGVATVVYRLFELIKPTISYFGLKDYQQFLVIKKMVDDFKLPIVISGLPIVREPSGLALSSRNQYLDQTEKEEALVLYQSLKKLYNSINGKKNNVFKAKQEISELLTDKRWDYLEIRDAETLDQDLTHSSKVVLLGVYKIGSTRLLDNLQVEIE